MFLETAKASPKQSVGCMHAHMAIAHEDVAHLVLGKCFWHGARGILTDSKLSSNAKSLQKASEVPVWDGTFWSGGGTAEVLRRWRNLKFCLLVVSQE